MRKLQSLRKNRRHELLAALLRGVREVLYVGWALTALTFCGLVAAGLL